MTESTVTGPTVTGPSMTGTALQLPHNGESHLQLWFYAAVSHLLEQVIQSFGSLEVALAEYPFLSGYHDELVWHGFGPDERPERALQRWSHEITAWESECTQHLPLRAIQQAYSLEPAALAMLVTVGLCEEDARFGLLFEALQVGGAQHRPTLGLLVAWWRDAFSERSTREVLRCLLEAGLLTVSNPDAPRLEWALGVPATLWDALHGSSGHDWAIHRQTHELPALEALILPDELRHTCTGLPALLAANELDEVIVRGPKHGGRSTLLAAIAKALGQGTLEVQLPANDERWRVVVALGIALNAMPILRLEAGSGERLTLPIRNAQRPFGVTLGRGGALEGQHRSVSINLEMPEPIERQAHWTLAFGPSADPHMVQALAQRYRLPRGLISHTARLAQAQAKLDGRNTPNPHDINQAVRTHGRETLETLAAPMRTQASWQQLAADSGTLEELHGLENRCRHREDLRGAVGPALEHLNVGVRALFSGPSGTGKTLAATLLAGTLGMDLYRLDLSSVINKYIGETEKNLERLFARAEELDVILLIDEGDALLTNRTGVSNANDRYANLETNFLLQRLEHFDGILIVTTNASDRIDTAFQRRMDVVIEFRAPNPNERLAILKLHLPSNHAVPENLLEDIAVRCPLTGGQLRNTALHAALLALETPAQTINGTHLETAVRREYRKAGQVCPLRSNGVT